MTTLSTTTLDALNAARLAYSVALSNSIAAWKSQSVTTSEEGYNRDQADAAYRQAIEADAVLDEAYFNREQAYIAYFQNEPAPDAHLDDVDCDIDTDTL
jgi:hypothetical protein